MNQIIRQHFSGLNLDIRKSGNARFMDQKVTPDVLSFIAECVISYVAGTGKQQFTKNDIWKFRYFVVNAQAVFNKPSPRNLSAGSEYDKFISQPLKALAYAGILSEAKVKGENVYAGQCFS